MDDSTTNNTRLCTGGLEVMFRTARSRSVVCIILALLVAIFFTYQDPEGDTLGLLAVGYMFGILTVIWIARGE